MSASDRYFTIPLSILRSGDSALAVLEACISVGLVNAGIGYRETHGKEEFQTLLEEADEAASEQGLATKPPSNFKLQDSDGNRVPPWRAASLWKAAHAGAKLLKISGGNRAGDAQAWASHHHEGGVFFKIKSDWLWSAVVTARREAGGKAEGDYKPISWREFRILAAILSAPLNKAGFVFLGWESIQARASGYHTKELFRLPMPALPNHCQPLSRSMIRSDCERLERLGFFARVRYAAGDRGGYMAYSFRHERQALIEAVNSWRNANLAFKAKIAANRSADKKAFKRGCLPPTNRQHKKAQQRGSPTTQPSGEPTA